MNNGFRFVFFPRIAPTFSTRFDFHDSFHFATFPFVVSFLELASLPKYLGSDTRSRSVFESSTEHCFTIFYVMNVQVDLLAFIGIGKR